MQGDGKNRANERFLSGWAESHFSYIVSGIADSMAFICIALNSSVAVLTNKVSELLIPASVSSLILI